MQKVGSVLLFVLLLEGLLLTAHKAMMDVKNNISQDFPGDTVVKKLPANAGDMGSRPGPGRSHMPWNS